ncbi:hypothetical protein Tco_0440844, partial [Tanacetum coccineum]
FPVIDDVICHFLMCRDDDRSVLSIACGCNCFSPKEQTGSLEAESIIRAASTRVRFHLSTTLFCSSVQGVEV